MCGSWSLGGGQRLYPDVALQGEGRCQDHEWQQATHSAWEGWGDFGGSDIGATAKLDLWGVPIREGAL